MYTTFLSLLIRHDEGIEPRSTNYKEDVQLYSNEPVQLSFGWTAILRIFYILYNWHKLLCICLIHSNLNSFIL